MKKTKKKIKSKTTPFQSDIVIDEEGVMHISFLGPELLSLVGVNQTKIHGDLTWKLNIINAQEEIDKSQPTIETSYAQCDLCPKECGFDRLRNTHPHCGNWKLKIGNMGLSFGDEVEISAGGGSGILLISGCPLTCPSCINPEKVRNSEGEVSLLEFLEFFETLYLNGANNIQILSPSVNLPHIKLALQILKNQSFPIPIIFKSSGHENVQWLKEFEGLVDIYLPDYKFFNSTFWVKESGIDNYHEIFLKTLEEMYRQVGGIHKNKEGIIQRGVIIRHITNPYLSEPEKLAINDFLQEQPQEIMVSLLNNFIILE